MNKIIAEHTFWSAQNEDLRELKVQIFEPQKTVDAWTCSMHISDARSKLPTPRGDSSLQCLSMAIWYVYYTLLNRLRSGEKLYYEETTDNPPVDEELLEAIFAQHMEKRV